MIGALIAGLLSMSPAADPGAPGECAPAVVLDLQEPQSPGSTLDYELREAASRDLEEFRGGGAGLVVLIVLVVAVLVLVSIIIPW